MSENIVFKAKLELFPSEVSVEDGGRAKMFDAEEESEDLDNGLFVRVQSWSEDPDGAGHNTFNSMVGKQLEITIKVLE